MADVAAAGVSVATVSSVLSGKRAVKPETRAAVEAAIRQLGFVPNTAGRSLRTGRSSLVALVVPNLANPFFARLAAALQEHLRDLGLQVVVCDTRADRREEPAFVREAVQQHFAGVVITPFRLVAKDLEPLARAGVPTVVSADIRLEGVDRAEPEARSAMRAALTAVTEAGRRGHRHDRRAAGRDRRRPTAVCSSRRSASRRLGVSAPKPGTVLARGGPPGCGRPHR
ncbi:LacI family DNA-binding transcriptional regulator [Kitasatospora cineracea]